MNLTINDIHERPSRLAVRARPWLLAQLLLIAAMMLVSSTASALVNAVVTISSTENPVASGKGSAFIIVQVRGDIAGSPLPAGTVTFSDSKLGGIPLCVATLGGNIGNNTAQTACKVPASAVVGDHNVIAIYNGNSFYKATISESLILKVLPSFTVTGAAVGGTASPTARTFVMSGFGVGFDFTANPGFRFVRVDTTAGCGGSQPAVPISATTYHFDSGAITANCTITGVFTNRAMVTPIADTGGQISPSSPQSVPFGSTLTVTVTPNLGFRLTNVNGCGVVFFGGPSITDPTTWTTGAINSDCRVESFFTALPTFTVNATAGAGGNITPATRAVPQGTTGAFTVTPNTGFVIDAVSGCDGSLSGSTYTTGAITTACNVSATFREASVTPPAVTTTPMIEFLHPPLNYFFVTSKASEIAILDRTPPFVRTGQSFLVYPSALPGTQPITRFYFDKVAVAGSRGSHFYTLVDAELSILIRLNPGNVAAPRLPISEGVDSFAFLPLIEGVGGSCGASLVPVFRLFRSNARFPDDPNHRFTTSTAIYNSFVAQGWDGEGVKFCVPG